MLLLMGTLSLPAAETTVATNENLNANASADVAAGDAATIKAKLNEQLNDAIDFYKTLLAKDDTAVSAQVAAQAKGVLIINRWSGGVGVGATGGYAIGLKKMSNGRFSGPVFYTLEGASLGLQVGGEKTHTVAFLMSDTAVRTLTEGKFVWSGNLKAVAGAHASSDSTLDNTADVVLYQSSAGLDVGAVVAATKVAVDEENTQKFYGDASVTADEILSGKVAAPAPAKILVASADVAAGDAATIKVKLNEQLKEAAELYKTLLSKDETTIPNYVVAKAKGVLVINRWSGGVGAGATGGYAIGFKMMSNRRFSGPVFYTLEGASLGLQVGGEETHTLAFLMSDKAMRTLTEGNFAWSGNLNAVAGAQVNGDTTLDNTTDVILYQSSAGLDVGAVVAATKVAVDEENTQKFYGNTSITANAVFSDKVAMPSDERILIGSYLTRQANNIFPILSAAGTEGYTTANLVQPNAPGGPTAVPTPGTASPMPGVQQTVSGAVNVNVGGAVRGVIPGH